DLARSLLLDLRYLGARQLEDVTRVARWRRESGDSGAVMVPADNLPYRPWGTVNVEPIDARGLRTAADQAVEYRVLPEVTDEELGVGPLPDGLALTPTRRGQLLHRADVNVDAAVAALNAAPHHGWRMRLSVDAGVRAGEVME